MSMTQKVNLISTDVDSKELRKVLRDIPKEVQQELRRRNKQDAEILKNDLIQAAYVAPGAPAVAERVAKSVTAASDRNIKVSVGGAKKVGKPYRSRQTQKITRATAGRLLYGSEHGGVGGGVDSIGRTKGNRFKSPHKKDGYWIAPTVKEFSDELLKKWEQRVTQLMKQKRFD